MTTRTSQILKVKDQKSQQINSLAQFFFFQNVNDNNKNLTKLVGKNIPESKNFKLNFQEGHTSDTGEHQISYP